MLRKKALCILLALTMICGTLYRTPVVYASELEETNAAVETIAAEILESIPSKGGDEAETAKTEEAVEAAPVEADEEAAPAEAAAIPSRDGDSAEAAEEDENEDVTGPEVAGVVDVLDNMEQAAAPEAQAAEDAEPVEDAQPADAEPAAVEDAEPEVAVAMFEQTEFFVPAEVEGVEGAITFAEPAFYEPVELVVSVLAPESSEYQAAEAALAEDGQKYDGMMALDISFVSEDGRKLEPKEGVAANVAMSLKQAALPEEMNAASIDTESVTVTHITQEAATEVVADTASFVEGTVAVVADEAEVQTIDTEFTVESFSTFAITWINAEEEKETTTVHWGKVTDGVFEEFNAAVLDLTAASISLRNSFDEDGYIYQSAEYCAPGVERGNGIDILSDLYKQADGTWQYTQQAGEDAPEQTGTLADGGNIYCYYYKPGSPNPSGAGNSNIPSPTTTKTVESNGDGTYTITLDVQGKIVQQDDSHYANVLIILDATRSMNGAKWTNAKAAMNALIETLSEGENSQNAGKIDYALVTFGRSAEVVQDWTKDNAAFKTTCAGINMVSTSGTNWEAGMRGGLYGVLDSYPEGETAAKHDPTYVIFLTDGDPNVYYSSGSNTNYSNTGTTNGYNQNANTSANHSADEAKTIASNTMLYGIYCGDSGTNPSGESFNRLVNVITGEGQGGQKTIAANANTIQSEFEAIAETILKDLKANNLSLDDGIPSLSNVSAAVAGEASGFEYQIKGPDDEDYSAWAEAPGASYSNDNGVTWDLAEIGTVQPGTNYRLKFVVWPSQDAYDLIADLNNGIVEMSDDELTAAGIAKPATEGGEYTLKTNTHLNVSYQVGETNYTDAPYGNEIPQAAMDLPTRTITVEKKWYNKLDGKEGSKPVTLEVTKDGKPYLEGDDALVVDFDSNWISDPIYISMGQIRGTGSDYEVLEKGHDYEVIEPPEFAWNWELTSEVYHPMVINGTPTTLIKDDSAAGTDGTDYYTINGHKYIVATGDTYLTAVNNRRSWLQIEKAVTGEGAPADALFEYKITVTDPKGEDIWFSAAYPLEEGQETPTMVMDLQTTEATAEINEQGAKTGYFYVKSGTEFTVKIQAGWTLRFTNLRSETTYTIEEVNLPDGFKFSSAKGSATSNATEEAHQAAPTPASVNGKVATGTINVPNSEFYVDYTNEYAETDVSATKEWDDGDNRDGKRDDVTFVLLEGGKEVEKSGKTIAKDATGDALTVKWEKLPVYKNGEAVTYTVKEDGEADGKITMNGAEYTVTYSGDVENGFTIKNSYTPETTDVIVEKVWANADGTGTWPEGVTVEIQLTADDEPVDGKTATLTADEPSYTFENLPKNQNGTPIEYGVEEVEIPGYESEVGNLTDGKITITNTQETVEIEVDKVWANADGSTTWPEGVTVEIQLTADDEPVDGKTATLTADEPSHTFESLPKYQADGETEIEYSVDEVDVPGYESEVGELTDEGTITITNTQEAVEIEVKKVWANADGSTTWPEGVTVAIQLTADGSDVSGKTATLSATKTSEKFTGLPKYKADGTTEIVYSVKEVMVPGYTTEVGEISEGVITITNTQITTQIEVEKTWLNADGTDEWPEGVTVTVQLTADGSDVSGKTATLTADQPRYTFESLPKFQADGTTEIEYGVDEVEVAGYESEIGDLTESKITITNSQITTEVEVEKTWKNADGSTTWPEGVTVTVQLTADGTVVSGKTADLTAEKSSFKFESLPKYQADGVTEIEYNVEEIKVAGYESEIGALTSGKITITNTQVTTEVEVEKIWDNADGTDTWPEGAKVTIQLLADNEPVANKTAELSADQPSYTFESLPKYKADGTTAIAYTVEEDMKTVPAGYVNEKIDGNATDGFKIFNTLKPAEGDPPVKKVIKSNTDNVPSEEFKFTLTAKDASYPMPEEAGGKSSMTIGITMPGTPDWKEFGVITFTKEGTYVYTITEEPGTTPGYLYDDNEITITYEVKANDENALEVTKTVENKNTGEKQVLEGKESGNIDYFVFTNEYYVTEVKVTKEWPEDNKDLEWKIRPEYIKAELLANGEVTEDMLIYAKDNWTGTFEELPLYDAEGALIKYEVQEVEIPGYTSTVEITAIEEEDEDGIPLTTYEAVITNELNDFKPVESLITVFKAVGGDLPATPDEFKFELKAEGEAPLPGEAKDGVLEITLKAGASSQFKFAFSEPDTYEYTLTEVDTQIPNCTFDTAVFKLKFEVTANAETEELEVKLTVTKDGKAAEGAVCTFTNIYNNPPKTGDPANMGMLAALMVSSAGGAAAVIAAGKKRRREEDEDWSSPLI